MERIEIKKTIKLADIESYYELFYALIKNKASIDLMLPKELDYYYIGLVPSLYQFIITWTRYQYSGKLLLDVDDPNLENFTKLYENELLFPIISLVWNRNEVYNKHGNVRLRPYLKRYNQEVFDKMRGVKQINLFEEFTAISSLKGSSLLLTEFDHLLKQQGILPCFEVNGEFVQNESIFAANIITGIKQVLRFSFDIQYNFNLVSKVIVSIPTSKTLATAFLDAA